ncbi:ssDNA-binding domain-containing protein [Prevotella melaninogenica]|uniref:zincin-like metallopeptidase domain-containing protein n=1 Tax=Prevotella melaninogenica TaxID=28132 RepID=UPI001D14DACF|nr:ArdC-like ssDNA-binding domain-containing protein [Prevotella melaninogenica]UEB01018.1 ssDNA-binding domain-containing protein [Prevotella melaninogenica]
MPGKKNKKHQSSYERSNKSADNLQKFAEMMSNIIIKAKSKNWKQGWLGVKGTILGLPQNITGRTYSGGNSFFLMADTSEKGYNTPVYMTFKQAKDRNLHVNAGEKSVPIFKWGLSIKDENGKTVSEEDYNAMTKEERDKFSVRPYPKVYHVFNIDQTNLSEVNKKKYDAIVARFKAPDEEVKDSKGMYINDALDRMFKEKAWHCDIRYNKPSSRAFYVPLQDFIVLPMKEQFNIGKTAEEVYRDGMEYYSTALHEMAHSTGHESRLNRQFGAKRTDGYAHEELIAEMTAALVGSTMGFDKKILENNANYLKGWLENLKRNPESITTIMSDVGKASDMIIEKIDEQRVALGQTPLKEGNLEGLTEDLGEETQQSSKISNIEAPQEEISGETVTSSDRQDDDISNAKTTSSKSESTELIYSNGKQRWDSFDSLLKAAKEHQITRSEFMAMSAFNIVKDSHPHNLTQAAIEYLQQQHKGFIPEEPIASGSPLYDAINMLKEGKVFAEYRGNREVDLSSSIKDGEMLSAEEIEKLKAMASDASDDKSKSSNLDKKPLIEKVPYGEFYLPEWSISYLKDGNEYGLTAEQLKTVKDFEKDFPSKLSIEITESSIEGNHNTELGPATTVDKAKIYYFEQHISDLFPTDESTRDRLDKDLSEDNKNRKTLSDLQAQYSNINAQYPAAVNDERTHQLAKRIRQAEQIITAYNANVEAVYGQDFMFSEAANKVMIPQSIYSGQLKPLSVVQDQGADQEKKVSVPDSLQVPVWEAYEKEKSQTGDFTYQDTAEEYGNMLLKGVENILPRIKGTLTIDQWGSDVLSAKIENDPRIFDTYIIPEPLKAWLEVSPKEESHSNMQGSSTGKNVDIVAAYAFSTILLQKENQEVGLSFTIDGKQWDNYDEIMQGNSDHVISDEAFAAAWALQSSMGISKHDLSKNAVAVLKDHIDTTEYYGEPTLNGSKGGIELLQSGKVSADYSVKGQQVTVEASPKIEEELHPEQVKEIIEANESFQESKETDEDISLSEDSNPETNVASIAKNIMEKGNVPKEVAEKQATVIADAQQAAIEEKKQKAEQAKQAALKKAEDERRREVEEEKRREEENKQQEKDSGPSSKLLLHAALLLGALELAKGNKGIWMNKAGKSNAEFIGAKRPIMAYNNIMMNLQSDRQGYRSNVYTTYDSAKDAGTAVKQNEESLAFNWVKWDYQHVGTKELISREDYDKLPAEEKEFYTKHKSKEEYGIFNIDQTTMPAGKQADYTALLKDKGAKIDQLSERGVSSMMKFAEKLKSNHPTSMVIARTDSKYQIYGKDASRAGKLLNLPVSQTEENGQKVKSVSFPLDRINDYLPKLVEAKQWVVVAENLDSAELIRQLPNEKEVISNANQTAQRVAKSAGIGYERVMVLQDAAYDKQADKIIVSGMSDKDAGDSRQAALQKANDIYRAVVAATGSEHRLDRMGRNNLLPVDDAKYERFVQDLAAGVLMARQGLPATLSKESMQNVNYLQREIRENPKMLGLIEKDVNNAIESIDKHLKQEIVKYEDIRKELTPKDLIVSPKQYKISSDLAKIPDIESKQIVIVRDKAKGAADVILPEGASLDDDVEISGIRKDRIKIALGKEGISDVKFYNAGGGLGLNETNDYYKGKEVSVDKLKQYDFSQHRDIDVKPQIEAAKVANIKLFTPIKDDKGQYAFFFKVDNEPSFAVYPNEAHKRAYFDARNTDQKKEIHEALAQKYYSVAQKHPEIKVDLIMPKVPAVDMSKIERPTITKDRDDPNKKYVMATIDGKLMKEPISKEQWNKMWLADDMAEYKKAVAAVTFAPFLKVEEKNENPIKQEKQENVSSNQEQTLSQSEDTNEEDVQQEETTPRTVKPRGMGIG